MKKLFTSDKFFLATVLCAVTGAVIYKLMMPLTFDSVAELIVLVCCQIALYFAYWKHSKNVMKGLLGALLMDQLLVSISAVPNSSHNEMPFAVIYLVLIFALSVSHFIINSERHSSPRMVRINQIIAVLIVLTGTAWNLLCIVDAPDSAIIVSSLFAILGFAGEVCLIVCVESRLDAYRLDREAAGWTEEKGYPEGYVHEHEKK